KKVSAIIDFDKEAKKQRDAAEPNIAAIMEAAYRIYAQGAAMAPELTRWVEYLRDRQRPELAEWRAATDANRKEVAARYQEQFRRSAYQYDQDLNWWKEAQNSFPNAGKIAGPRPSLTADKHPFFVAVWQDSGPLHRTRDEQLAALAPEKAREA